MPVFSETAIQISGTSTPSRSNVTIVCFMGRGCLQSCADLSSRGFGAWERTGGSTHLLRERVRALLHFIRRHILDVRGDGPHVAEGIGQRGAAVAVELVLQRLLHD